MRGLILGLGLGLLVAGCAATPPLVYESYSGDGVRERQLILSYIHATYFDPHSIQDAQVSQPFLIASVGGRLMCLQVNAKNRLGGYTGLQTSVFAFDDGGVPIQEVTYIGYCLDAHIHYSPFPEAEQL